MAVTLEEVEHIARLAKLSFSREEKVRFIESFNQILAYIDKLNELDLDDVAPTAHVLDLKDVTRPDEIGPGLENEEALANAPRVNGAFFSVPKVLDS